MIRRTAAARGFNKLPYAGYSGANTVAQSLRPFPQFGNIASLGVPDGESKYDSLQVKANKRYSHGLNLTATFTWQNERTNMVTGAGTTCGERLRPSRRRVHRVRALGTVDFRASPSAMRFLAFSSNKFVRAVLGGWTFGGMVRYASGMPIPVPASQNQISALTFQTTTMNRVKGSRCTRRT